MEGGTRQIGTGTKATAVQVPCTPGVLSMRLLAAPLAHAQMAALCSDTCTFVLLMLLVLFLGLGRSLFNVVSYQGIQSTMLAPTAMHKYGKPLADNPKVSLRSRVASCSPTNSGMMRVWRVFLAILIIGPEAVTCLPPPLRTLNLTAVRRLPRKARDATAPGIDLSVCADERSLLTPTLIGSTATRLASGTSELDSNLMALRRTLEHWRRPALVHAHELLVPIEAGEFGAGATLILNFANLIRALGRGLTPVHVPLILWTNATSCPAMDMSCWFSSLLSLDDLQAACSGEQKPCPDTERWNKMRSSLAGASQNLAYGADQHKFDSGRSKDVWVNFVDAKTTLMRDIRSGPINATKRVCRENSLRCPQFVHAGIPLPGYAGPGEHLAKEDHALAQAALKRLPNLGSTYRTFAELLSFQLTPNQRLGARLSQLRSELGFEGQPVLGVHARIGGDACTSHGECRSFASLVAPIQRMIDAYGFTTAYLATVDADLIRVARGYFPALRWMQRPPTHPGLKYDKSFVRFEEGLVRRKVDPLTELDEYMIDVSLLASTQALIGSFASSVVAVAYGMMTARASVGCFPPYASIDTAPICGRDPAKILTQSSHCPQPAEWKWGQLMNALRSLGANSDGQSARLVKLTLRCPVYAEIEPADQLMVPHDAPILKLNATWLWFWCCEPTNRARSIRVVAPPTSPMSSEPGGVMTVARLLWRGNQTIATLLARKPRPSATAGEPPSHAQRVRVPRQPAGRRNSDVGGGIFSSFG